MVGLVVAGVVVSNSSAGFRRIQYVISLSSLLAPPTLIAHATRLKFFKFSLDTSYLHGKEQKEAGFSITFLAALCNVIAAQRIIEAKQLKLSLDISNLHGRAARMKTNRYT